MSPRPEERKSIQDASGYPGLQREAQVARALRAVAGALGAFVEVDELVALLVEQVSELMHGARVEVLILDERNRQLSRHPGTAAGGKQFVVGLERDEGLLNYVLRSGRRTWVDDFASSEFEAEWDKVFDTVTKSSVVAPLRNNLGRSMGALLVASPEIGAFVADDLEVLSIFAKQAAMVIDNSRLLASLIQKNNQLSQAQEQLTRRVRDLELLFELERQTAQAESHEELARAVLESLARACNAGGALLVLSEEDGSEYLDYSFVRAARVSGELVEAQSSFVVGISKARHDLLGPIFSSSEPVQVDAMGAPLKLEGLGQVVSLIAEPLEGEGEEVLGALALVNKRGGPFTAEDLGLLRLVGANLSTALRLFNAKQIRQRESRLSNIGRLLSQVVHDLKSPLTVISGYVQLMEDSKSPVVRKTYAAEILKQFQAMGAMQREVLAFARGETQIFARQVIMDRLLSDLSEQMKLELATRKVTLLIESTPRLVAHLDSERLMRALMNLIRNAAEAMEPEGGSVSIRASGEGSTLTIRVADTGPGVPEELVPRMFQSFVTSGKSEGTGLGLAIVKRIVEEHGGSVRLCPVSRGACFLLTFPDSIEGKAGPPPEMVGTTAPSKKALAKKAPTKAPTERKTPTTKVSKNDVSIPKTRTKAPSKKKAAAKTIQQRRGSSRGSRG